MIEEAGTHASYFQTKYQTFPERLAANGYFAGSVGKGWGPGNFKKNGRTENPAGKSYRGHKDYLAGFQKFLADKPNDKPFCFWFGSSDAHRSYAKESGLKAGKTLKQAEVPRFLPDAPEIRSDLLDYAMEVERFDKDCGKLLQLLEETGQLDNTLVIITSDNGMPFPRAKANCYEYGLHMPLAIDWGSNISGGRKIDDLIGFVDITATIYEATGVEGPSEFPVAGRSFLKDLRSKQGGLVDKSRDAVFAGRERHSSSRFNTLSYPQRAIRTNQHLYIRNFKPERWPAGPSERFDKAAYDEGGKLVDSTLSQSHAAYHDIDACPSLSFLVDNLDHPQFGKYLGLAVDRRPVEELFDTTTDPDCLHNLAESAEHQATKNRLQKRLFQELQETGDSRLTADGDVWETYPRVSGLRWFPTPDWAEKSSGDQQKIPWVEKRRPRQERKP